MDKFNSAKPQGNEVAKQKVPHTARHTYLFTQHKLPIAILKVLNYSSSVSCKNDTLNRDSLQDSRKHSEAFTSILAYAPENRNHLEIFIMFLQNLAKVGPQPLIENARKPQDKSWALLLNALFGTFCYGKQPAIVRFFIYF